LSLTDQAALSNALNSSLGQFHVSFNFNFFYLTIELFFISFIIQSLISAYYHNAWLSDIICH